MADILLATIKRGTPEKAPDKIGIQHGQFCDFIRVSQKDYDTIKANGLYPMSRKAYMFMAFPEDKEAWLREQIAPVYDPKDVDGTKILSTAQGYVNWDELAKVSAFDKTRLLDGSPMAELDATAISTLNRDIFKRYDLDGPVSALEVIDKAAITAGSYTFGGGVTSSPHYATRKELVDDLGNLTGNLTATNVASCTETGQSTISISLGSYDLTITTDSDPQGDPTSGYLISENLQDYGLALQMEGPGNVIVEKQHTKRLLTAYSGRSAIMVNDIATACNIIVSGCLLDGNGLRDKIAIRILDNTPICEIYNNVGWEHDSNSFNISANNASNLYENNIGHADYYGGFTLNNLVLTLRNCISSKGTVANFQLVGNATGRNCATSAAGAIGFATESGTVSSVADSDFVSVSDANAEFLKHDLAGILDRTGSAPAIAENTAGINGVARTATNVSIGAWEYPAVSGGAQQFKRSLNGGMHVLNGGMH